MKNILDYFEKVVKENNNKIAVIEEDKSINYNDLMIQSRVVGTNLIKQTETRKPIVVMMDKGINTLCAFLGIMYSGCFYCLVNPDLPIIRINKILEKLNPEIIISDSDNINIADQVSNGRIVLKIEDIICGEIDEKLLYSVRNKSLDVDPLYVNFTSGSTGAPKGVVINHLSVIDFINIFVDKFNITNNDIIGNQAPFDFDVSVKDIYSTLLTGATLVIIPKKYFLRPTELLDYICDNNVTTLIWAVSALCLITTFHGLDYKVPSKVNKILFSGEQMPIKHLKEWIKFLPNTEFINVYGPTEITCNCTYHIVDKTLNYDRQIPIGQSFENEQVFLLDENNQIVLEPEKIGEICVKGSCLSLGYYNSKIQSDDRFIQNPLNQYYRDIIYKTGDLGFWDENNDLYFAGRKDFQIKHLGHRIELEEIERAIESIEDIVRACCIYDEKKNKIIAFYIGDIDKKEIIEKLKEIVPVYMVPNMFKNIDEFKLNKNGKIDRNFLKSSLEIK